MSDSAPTPRSPKYVQLAQYLEENFIRPGSAHDVLPTERELQDRCGVSRDTVRRAIALLARQGLVYNKQGSGTFIADRKASSKKPALISFTRDMHQRGMVAATTTLSCYMVVASPSVVRDLGLCAGDKVIEIVRLRWADGEPIALETAHFLPEAFAQMEPETAHSLEAQLAHSGYRIVRSTQRIRATNLTASEAEHLAVPQASAALAVRRIGYADSGRAIESTTALYRADRYDFELELTR